MTEVTLVEYGDMLAATTIAVVWDDNKNFEDLIDGDELSFTDESGNGSNLVFITDISHDKAALSYKAKFVSVARAAETIQQKSSESATSSIPLFIVHGFNVQPAEGLETVAKSTDYFKEEGAYYPVPVIWPSSSAGDKNATRLFSYKVDQRYATANVAKSFKAFVDNVSNDTFPRKALMMHSMGNHIVFNGACGLGPPDVKFENIFMVASDVAYDIFAKDPAGYIIRCSGEKNGRKQEKAGNFLQMLETDPASGKPKGKIYIVFNYNDRTLKISKFINFETRLGRMGAGARKPFLKDWVKGADADFSLVNEELKDYIENKELTTVITEAGDSAHRYHLESYAVKFYSSKALK